MSKFHADLVFIEVSRCTTYSEGFPGCPKSVSDTADTRLYSSANNMDPGPVPPTSTTS